MKRLIFFLVFALTGSAWAQFPIDPRDSVILESKAVDPQIGPSAGQPVMRVRMDITNKDTLTSWVISFIESTALGNAYATLARSNNGTGPRNPQSVVTLLPHPNDGVAKLDSRFPVNVNFYHSNSPDSFTTGGVFTAGYDSTKEPPNPTRRPFLEINFDSVTGAGKFVLDTVRVLSNRTCFTRSPGGQRVDVNFVKSFITVGSMPKGDLNHDYLLNAEDVMLLLNCVFLNLPPPDGAPVCDLNCDGEAAATDVVILLLAVYLGELFPC